mgnify:FL=1
MEKLLPIDGDAMVTAAVLTKAMFGNDFVGPVTELRENFPKEADFMSELENMMMMKKLLDLDKDTIVMPEPVEGIDIQFSHVSRLGKRSALQLDESPNDTGIALIAICPGLCSRGLLTATFLDGKPYSKIDKTNELERKNAIEALKPTLHALGRYVHRQRLQPR